MNFNIGGFQKNTFIDYPGVVASIIFTQGCNFRCPYCHNPELISCRTNISYFSPLKIKEKAFKKSSNDVNINLTALPNKNSIYKADIQNLKNKNIIDTAEIFSFLKKRKGLIEGIVITGGEPALQKNIESFCFKVKNMGFKIKLDTNGSRPDVIEKLIQRELIDFIAMDIKTDDVGYHLLTIDSYSDFDISLILKSIQLIMEKSPNYEFRTTCVRPFINKEIMNEIGNMIKGASRYVIQHCSSNVKMLNPDFFTRNNLSDLSIFFTEDELLELKDIAQQYVQYCFIR